ncbi:unnamed protein product [Ectocarpus sp. 13 AM-2016]
MGGSCLPPRGFPPPPPRCPIQHTPTRASDLRRNTLRLNQTVPAGTTCEWPSRPWSCSRM